MLDYKKIIDISLPLSEDTVAYPGTPKIEIEKTTSETTKMTVSIIRFSSHTGTHIDAPSHAFQDGENIDAIALDKFIGPCRVVDCTLSKENISLGDVKKLNPKKGERILFKTTNSKKGFKEFYPDFVYLSGEGAEYLASQAVGLVGIDSWSIKKRGSQDNRPHTALLSKGIPIIEGLDLSQAEVGKYFLVLLPLKFTGIDGSPARAVLLKE